MIAPAAESREQIEVLHDPLAPFRGPRGSDIHPISGGEQPERATDARIHVKNLVLPVAQIVPVSNIENSVIPNLLHEIDGSPFNRLVAKTDSQAGHAGIHRKPAYLLTGHAKDASRVLIEIAIEHPILAGDEFLD